MKSNRNPDALIPHPIAAVFAWLIASLTLLLGIVYIIGITVADYADPNFWNAAICMTPILLSASLLNAIAGFHWLRGFSLQAFAMQIVGAIILFGGSGIVTRFVIA